MERAAMDVKEAVRTAKRTLTEVFSDEKIQDLGLEEVNYHEGVGWEITLGFWRPWDTLEGAMAALSAARRQPRSFKVVALDDAGKLLSITNREPVG
ncbi:MAG: hypothetical protein ACREFQ_08680 [Stellaceae bacterium]